MDNSAVVGDDSSNQTIDQKAGHLIIANWHIPKTLPACWNSHGKTPHSKIHSRDFTPRQPTRGWVAYQSHGFGYGGL